MTRREASMIVGDIISDLTDRSGFDAIWDQMDVQDQEDLRRRWIAIVVDE